MGGAIDRGKHGRRGMRTDYNQDSRIDGQRENRKAGEGGVKSSWGERRRKTRVAKFRNVMASLLHFESIDYRDCFLFNDANSKRKLGDFSFSCFISLNKLT